MKTLSLKLSVAAFALVGFACSQPTLIDRTQPNYMKKADLLDGAWYIQEQIVEAPQNAALTIQGFGGGLEKVRWEIHEDMLVGYRAYEFIPGIDPRVDQGASRLGHVVFKNGQPYKGSPVVAYKITSHFDRQRQYNAATGEQTNVLVEDTSDRPWYEREYMRVDWRRSQITNYGYNVPEQPGADPSNRFSENWFRYVTDQDQNQQTNGWVEERDAKGSLKYFDFTSEAIADPPTLYYPGYGNIPYCLFKSDVDCESELIRVRTSVKRVDDAHVMDYEPLQYDDSLMVKFGFFRNTMRSYNQGYGYTESGRILYAMRHDIWAKAHDAQGNTIPVEQRGLKPIVYYVGMNTPKELIPAAKLLEKSWNHAFQRAVAVPRGFSEDADGTYNSSVGQMFYVCDNPVPAGAPAQCGAEGTFARPGDIRYNQIPYVQQLTGGLLGLGPSSMDPETGEVVQATANVYGPMMDYWAATGQQTIDVINGDITLQQLIDGADTHKYVFAHLNPTDPRRPANGPWTSTQGLTSDSTKPMGTFWSPTGNLSGQLSKWVKDGHLPLRLQDRKAVVDQLIASNPALQSELINLPEVKAGVVGAFGNTQFVQRLLTDNDLYASVARGVLLGTDPGLKMKQAMLKTVDPKVGCYYGLDYTDDDYVGIAKTQKSYFDAQTQKYVSSGNELCANTSACTLDEAKGLAHGDVFTELRIEAYRAVAEHEVGHTLGLMHNFIGSADPLNYKDGYWDLRKETIGVQVGGKRVMPVNAQDLVDASKPNQHQIDSSMYELEYSSIMDYGARVNSDHRGIGKYDEAAILFAYSGGQEPGWVEVFNDMRKDYTDPQGNDQTGSWAIPTDNMNKVLTIRGAFQELPYRTLTHYTPVSSYITDVFHYTTLPFMFADPIGNMSNSGDFQRALDQGITRMNSRSLRKWSEMKPMYDAMAEALHTYQLSEGGFNKSDWEVAPQIVKAAARGMPVEVPYMYCSDYEIGANALCGQHDQGADMYELTGKWMERYQQTYPFMNFRRDRVFYSPNSVFQGKFGRYLGAIPNVYQHWLFDFWWTQNAYNLTQEQMDQFFGVGDPIWQNYFTMGVIDSTNLLMQQMSTPSAGYHGLNASGNWVFLPNQRPDLGRYDMSAETDFVTQTKAQGFTDVVYVPRGPGRSMFTQYDPQGYDNFRRVDEVGHFWDQVAALSALTTSETSFLGVDRGSDALKYSLPYFITFHDDMAPLFSSMWAEQRGSYGGSLGKLADGTPAGTAVVVPPTFVKGANYVIGFNYPPAQGAPVDLGGNPMTMKTVEANPTWSTRFYGQLWAMAFFTDNFNQQYASFNQVFKLGSGEALSPAQGWQAVIFPDPSQPATVAALPSDLVQGYQYAALKLASDPRPQAAAASIDTANQQAAKYVQAKQSGMPVDGLDAAGWEGKMRETVRNLEVMRGLYDIFGRTW